MTECVAANWQTHMTSARMRRS